LAGLAGVAALGGYQAWAGLSATTAALALGDTMTSDAARPAVVTAGRDRNV
jgi:hypothetical protein